jgi:hypothetical protein
MTIKERKKSLKELGKFLRQFKPDGIQEDNSIAHNALFMDAMKHIIKHGQEVNPWFTPDNIRYALATWGESLTPEKIDKWLDQYQYPDLSSPKNVGVIMAGNIPMVGFHDFISTLMSGNKIKAKLSSNDKQLLPLLAKFLEYQNPKFKELIEFVPDKLTDMDGVIATGSDNTARYFEYYFGKYPHIIRKNRNSVAVLTGDETEEELEALADDIMRYFGLGCRNVSKIFVPKGYDFNKLFKALLKYKDLINYPKYANNYNYNKAVYLMSTDQHEKNSLLDNGLVLLKEDIHYASPIGTLFYEFYDNIDDVKKIIEKDKDKIQAVVGNLDIPGAIPFGKTQQPELWDYADGVDTMDFLIDLKNHNKKN